MNRKNLPLFLMLTAGAVVCIITFIQGYSMLTKLVILFFVFLLFYGLGSILRVMLDEFDRKNEKEAEEARVAQEAAAAEEQALSGGEGGISAE